MTKAIDVEKIIEAIRDARRYGKEQKIDISITYYLEGRLGVGVEE